MFFLLIFSLFFWAGDFCFLVLVFFRVGVFSFFSGRCFFSSFFFGLVFFLVFSVLCRIGFPGWCARLGSDMPRLCPDSSKNQMIEMENLNKEKERLNGKYDLFIGFDERDLESL